MNIDNFMKKVYEKLGISDFPLLIEEGGLKIKISCYRNASIWRGRSRISSSSRTSAREWVILEGSILKETKEVSLKRSLVKVPIWKNDTLPNRLVSSRIERFLEKVEVIKTSLSSELEKLRNKYAEEQSFKEFLEGRYRNYSKIEIYSENEANITWKHIILTLNRKEEVKYIQMCDYDRPTVLELANAISEIKPVSSERRSRFLRVETTHEVRKEEK